MAAPISVLESSWQYLIGNFSEFQLATVVTFLLHETVFFLSGLPSLLFERFGLFAKYKIQDMIEESITLHVHVCSCHKNDSMWPPEALVHSGRLKRADNVKRGRGRPNLTWKKSVKRDLKDWNITKELAMDRGAWKLAIHVPEL